MTTTYVGSLSLGDAVPGAAGVAVAGVAGINGALPDILARIAALQAFVPTDINFAAQLSLAQATVTSIQAAITAGIPVPSIAAQIAAVAALIASLLAAVTSINAQLELIVDFQSLLGASGIHALAFAGTVGNLGSELDSAIAAIPVAALSSANALVLLTTVPATWTAMAQVFQVTP